MSPYSANHRFSIMLCSTRDVILLNFSALSGLRNSVDSMLLCEHARIPRLLWNRAFVFIPFRANTPTH